jgi:hypothetical protein
VRAPLWLVPATLFVVVAIAISVLTATALVVYANNTVASNEAYFNLIYPISYVMTFATTGVASDAPPPVALLTEQGLQSAMSGAWTLQYAGLALVFLLSFLLFAASYAYARALVFGHIERVYAGEKPNLFAMFRAARTYWLPSLWYALPFAVLTWIAVMLFIPIWVRDIALPILNLPAQFGVVDALLIGIVLFGALLAALTVLGEAAILRGSRSPIRESMALATLHPLSTLGVIAVTSVVTAIILVLDWLRSTLSVQLPNTISALIVLFVFVVIVAAWRVWAAAYVAALVPAENQKVRTPRDA